MHHVRLARSVARQHLGLGRASLHSRSHNAAAGSAGGVTYDHVVESGNRRSASDFLLESQS